MIFPSVISGHNPNGPTSEEPIEQIRQAFINMEDILRTAGATTGSIAKIVVYLRDFSHRKYVNDEWIKMFPHEDDRPARHVMKIDMQGKAHIQMDVIAVVDD
jgi:enamine deaminase RidA (YjgF/YER057c/UK114 family)